MIRNSPQWLALMVAFALPCAAAALEGPELADYAKAKTIEVLTHDEDGDLRETTIWIVVLDGAAYINTNATTWGENVERTPRLDVRRAGSTRSFDIRFLEDATERHRVQLAFREKYGFQDKLLGFFMDESEATIMQLVESPNDSKGESR